MNSLYFLQGAPHAMGVATARRGSPRNDGARLEGKVLWRKLFLLECIWI